MSVELPELPAIPESERTPLVETLLQIIEIQRTILLTRIAELEAENLELKERIARLEKNSSTSSKPPSSDITKPESERRQPGERKIGGQPGHKGHYRREIATVDEVKDLHLKRCPCCGRRDLGEENPELVKIHRQAELVEQPVRVTEYRQFGRLCPCRNEVRYPALPQGVIASQLFGPKLLRRRRKRWRFVSPVIR